MAVKILVVEDELDVRELVSFSLQQILSFEVETIEATCVNAALNILKDTIPDLVITDVRMGPHGLGIPGTELVRFIRENPLTRHIPVIIMSARVQASEVAYFMECGATDFFTKPFAPDDFVTRVKLVLSNEIPHLLEQPELANGSNTVAPLEQPGELFEKPPGYVLPILLEPPKREWKSKFITLLTDINQEEAGRAVIALAAGHKSKKAPYNATEGQKHFWGHIRHTLASATAENAIASRSTLASVALALMQPVEKLAEALAAVMENECLECRRWALRILLENREPSAAEFATQELKSEDGEMRGIAAMTLAQMGTAQHIPLLTQTLNDPEPGVRENVAAALARIGGEAGTMALTAALEVGSPEAAEAAANALSKIGGEEAIKVLVAAANTRTEPGLIRQVALALGRIDDDRCRETLRGLVDHDDEKVRRTVEGLLESTGGSKVENTRMAGETILYIEDDLNCGTAVKKFMEFKGYVCIVATNGYEGLELAVNAKPDLILLDMSLPGINGFEIVRRLREDRLTAHIPIFALTAYDSKGVRESVLAAGCNGYITKPISLKGLLGQIKEAMAWK